MASDRPLRARLARGWIGLALFAAVCAAPDGGLAAAEDERSPAVLGRVTLQLKWRHQFQFAGYYVALAKGWYREAGLDVRLVEAGSDGDPTEAVVRGEAEYGIGTSDLLLLRARGAPVVALAAIFQHSPLVLLARQSAGIESVHDLAGKRVMIEHQAASILAYLRGESVPLDRLVRVPHGFDIGPMIDGTVDAMTAYSTDEPFVLRQADVDYLEFTPRAGGVDFYGDTLFTLESEIERHPERVRAFVAASRRGWAWAVDNIEETVDLILARYGDRHSREHLLFEAERTRLLMAPDLVEVGYMNPGRWRYVADIYAEMGMMPAGFDIDGFVWRDRQPLDLGWVYRTLAGAGLVVLVVGGVSVRFYRLNRALNREVAARRALEAELRRLVATDTLTGVANRRSFLERLGQELLRARRHGHALSLLQIDLDRFKAINDTHGHPAGDEVLCRFAATVSDCLRSEDVFGRTGGEEFAVALPVTDADAATGVAEKLRRAVAALDIAQDGRAIRVTVSIGVAEAAPDDTVDALVARADGALYAAKADGRDRVVAAPAPATA